MHEAIAVGGKRTRRALGIVVPRLGQRAQQRVALDDSRRDRRIHAAHQKHRQHARLDVLVGVADGIGRRSAARGHHVAVAAKAEAHADFAGDRAHGAAGDAEQADLLDVSAVPEPVLLFGKFLRAAAGAENHADLALFVHRHGGGIEARVLDGFGRGGHRPAARRARRVCVRARPPRPVRRIREFRRRCVPAGKKDRSGKCVSRLTYRREGRRQKASLPMPLGLTTPIPVITTRGTISVYESLLDTGLTSALSTLREVG